MQEPRRITLFTHDDARALLTLDQMSRRRRFWRLVDDVELAGLISFFTDRKIRCAVLQFADDIVHCPPLVLNYVPDLKAINSSAWFQKLAGKAPLLPRIFDVADGHLLVAGGSVVGALNAEIPSLMMDQRVYWWDVEDIDLFFYGFDTDRAANELLERIFENVFDPLPKDRVHMSRTELAVTVTVDTSAKTQCTYQFILRLYASVDNILGGFDLACCSVGYSPSTGLVATELGAWSIALSLVIVDCSQWSETFGTRIAIYNERGFCVVFPSVEAHDDVTFSFNKGKLRALGNEKRANRSGHRDWYLFDPDRVELTLHQVTYGPSRVAVFAYPNTVRVHPKAFYDDSPLYRETLVGLPTWEHVFVLRRVFAMFPVDLRNHLVWNYIIPLYVDRTLRALKARLPPLSALSPYLVAISDRVNDNLQFGFEEPSDFRQLDFNSSAHWDACEFLGVAPGGAQPESNMVQGSARERGVSDCSSCSDLE
jgi:hypothetical protein